MHKNPSIIRLFWSAHKVIWLVNFALPSKGFASFTPSKLRLAFPHEAQNFLSHSDFLMLVYLKVVCNIELQTTFVYGSYRNYGNVAIKREQRLLADYAEHEQRKDCEAGLTMGIMGIMGD